MSLPIRKVLSDQFRLLFFMPFKPDLARFEHLYIGWGLLTAWIAGIGRYWDHPNAESWQYLGFGSVAYVFLLALLLWVIVAPLKPKNWSYSNVLIFVALTSLPALLYAIPVEKFMAVSDAKSLDETFLLVVAVWRVALLFCFLRNVAGLGGGTATVAGLLPLALIVTVLTALNLEKAVFDIMGAGTDGSYLILVLLTTLSVIASPILLIAYGTIIYNNRQEGRAGL